MTRTARHWPINALFVVALAMPASAQGKAVTAHCESSVALYSWQPLPPKTIDRLVRTRVLQGLLKSGKISLQPAGAAKSTAALELKIVSRIIEDAGHFSVFVTAIPRMQNRAGSVAAVANRPILRLSHKGIQKQIEAAADDAARKLSKRLNPLLDRLSQHAQTEKAELLATGNTPMTPKLELPKEWGAKLVGRASGKNRAFLKKGRRLEALVRNLAANAGERKGDRIGLVQCALRAKDIHIRQQCVQALGPLSRKSPLAQRAILAVLIQKPIADWRYWSHWKKLRRMAFEISTTFDGPALNEAVQAWLFLLAADRSEISRYYGRSTDYLFRHSREDSRILDRVADYLVRFPNTPNLDAALAHCVRPSLRENRPPMASCLKAMKAIPSERRLALLYKQLLKPPAFSHYSSKSKWLGIVQTIVDRKETAHPLILKLCQRRIERAFEESQRSYCLELVSRQAPANKNLGLFLLSVFLSADKSIQRDADKGLKLLVERKRSLCPLVEKKLGPRVENGAYPSYPDMPEALTYCDEKRWPRWGKKKRRRR
jgi:hypothetical protein